MRLYKDFGGHFYRDTSNTQYTSYLFDNSPDYTLSRPDGTLLDVSGYAVSNNEKWMVAEINRVGLIRVNLQTLEIKRFSTDTLDYSLSNWPMPTADMAVSDDGSTVAFMGWHAREDIYSIVTGCGDTLTNTIDDETPINTPCPVRHLDSQLRIYFPNNDYARYPSFEDNGNVMTLFSTGRSDQVQPTWIKLVVNGYTEPHLLQYLAMGDSISSGEGDTQKDALGHKHYRYNTDEEEDKSAGQPREKCHLSTRSYPYLLARWMGLALDSPKQWDSVACSGATTYDMNDSDVGGYEGQYSGKGDTGLGRLHGFANKDSLQVTALNEFIPGRDKQIEFVEKYKPKVITLTDGANDIGFGDKLRQCINPLTTCSWASDKMPELASQIKNEYTKLTNLYTELYNASGGTTKIYVLGYPQLITDAEPASCGVNITLNLDERKMIVNATNYLNQVIEKAALNAGVKYVDISGALDGGELCQQGQMYMNGAIGPFTDREAQESFHPNDFGHIKITQAIQANLDHQGLLDYDNCPDTDDLACPNPQTAPPIPSSLGGETGINSRNEGVTFGSIVKTIATTFAAAKYTFQPDSTLSVSIHSDPVDLGQYTAGTDGSVADSITIPSSVPAGYHTLILSGQSYSGEPIEITQTILVTGSDPDDLDDNGTPDVQQPCGAFIPASGQDADMDGIDDACDPEISDTPQLYRVRQGDASRTYNGSPEHTDYLYIERNTRASSITGVTGDYDPDGDGWAIVGASQGTPYTTTSAPDTGPAANFTVSGSGASSVPYVYTRAGGYGCTSFTPTSLEKVTQGQSRTIKKVSYNTDKCRMEDPSDDVDGNGQPDDTQPLYIAWNGDVTKGEDPSRIYLYRNFYSAEAQLGISDYTPSGTPAGNPLQPIQPWNLLASSKPGQYIPDFNKLVILKDNNNHPLPTILTKKQNGQCIAYQPTTTTVIKKTVHTYLTKLPSVPEGVNCE